MSNRMRQIPIIDNHQLNQEALILGWGWPHRGCPIIHFSENRLADIDKITPFPTRLWYSSEGGIELSDSLYRATPALR